MNPGLKLIQKQLQDSIDLKVKVKERHSSQIEQIAKVLASCLKSGKKILFCGNGGSAADAQHLAAELVVRLRKNSKRAALPALALSTNTSILTACSNDLGFKEVYARQIEALGAKGDVLFAISTSGNSANMIRACQAARKRGLRVVSLLGSSGGRQKSFSHLNLIVPSTDTPRIQEAHITIGHIICDLIEDSISRRLSLGN